MGWLALRLTVKILAYSTVTTSFYSLRLKTINVDYRFPDFRKPTFDIYLSKIIDASVVSKHNTFGFFVRHAGADQDFLKW